MEHKDIKTIFVRFENVICQMDVAIMSLYDKKFPEKKKQKKLENFKFPFIVENYPEKDRAAIREIMNSQELWDIVEPVPEAIRSLNQMSGGGYHIKIVVTNLKQEYIPCASFKLAWIDKHLKFHSWFDRIVISDDMTIFDCDILIDCGTEPEKGIHSKQKWIHVVYDQPYNQHLLKQRLKSWKNWRLEIQECDPELFLENGKREYYIHGSKDSRDIDKYYLFDVLPSQAECYSFCNGSSIEDRNLIVVKNGFIAKVLKGRPDECNNSLFSTYKNFKQEFELKVKRKVTRIIPLKVISLVRKLIGICSNSEWRREIKDALKSRNKPYVYRLGVFEKIDFEKCVYSSNDRLKTLAFQFGITLALMKGIELYTKQEVCEMFPDLKGFIYLDEEYCKNNLSVLQKYKKIYVDALKGIDLQEDGNFVVLTSKKENCLDSPFHMQCNGIVVDTAHESCVCYPFDHCEIENTTWRSNDVQYYPPMVENVHNVMTVAFVDDEIKYFGPEDKIKILKESKLDLKCLKFDEYFHIFDIIKGEVQLVGLRCRLTNELVSKEIAILYVLENVFIKK